LSPCRSLGSRGSESSKARCSAGSLRALWPCWLSAREDGV
jgi:hypothetical protein